MPARLTTNLNFQKLTFLLLNFCAASFLAYSIFYRLGTDIVNVDQFLWLARSERFYTSIKTFQFQNTYQQYHPGVTVMYLVGLGQKAYGAYTGDWSSYNQIKAAEFPLYNLYTKFFLVLFVYCLILGSSYIISKLFNSFASLIFLSLMIFEPFLIGNIRNLHLDSILTFLIFITCLLFFYYLKTKEIRILCLSAIMLGLAFLTKMPSVFALPILALAFIVSLITKKLNLKEALRVVVIYLLGTTLTYFILFPSMWVAPKYTIERIIKDGVVDTGVNKGHTHYLNGERLRDPGNRYYMTVLKYRVSPLATFAIYASVLGILVLFRSKKTLFSWNTGILILSALFIAAYFYTFSHLTKKTDRYILPIYPFAILFISVSILSLWEKWKKLAVISLLLVAYLSIPHIKHFNKLMPEPMVYYNPKYGGIEMAKKEIYLNQNGNLLYPVALYLNSQNLDPNTLVGVFEDKVFDVWTDYKVQNLDIAKAKKYDFVIMSIQRGKMYPELTKGYKHVKTIEVDGHSYWKIYERSTRFSIVQNN